MDGVSNPKQTVRQQFAFHTEYDVTVSEEWLNQVGSRLVVLHFRQRALPFAQEPAPDW